MTFTAWLVVILVIQGIHFLGTWKLYQKAGRKPWEAIVPIYNGIVLMQIINRPKWWVILLFIPVINLIMFPVVWVETSRSFGKNSTIDTVLSIFSLGFYAYYLNYAADVTYIEDRSLTPKTEVGEWTSSILFAIVAATLVHTYVMQPYTIPTSSLEKSLLVGDFLFVSKFHYGAKTPTSLIAAPMVHDTLPFVKKKSYVYNDDPNDKNSFLNKFQLPYFRLPGFQDIKRNEIVVFNWPADTVRQFFTQDRKFAKPIDKKSNYVKRCVGIAGDSLEIRDGHIFINGERSILPERAKPQFYYTVDTDGKNMSDNMIYNTYHVRPGEARTTYKEYVLPLAYEKQLYNKFGKDYLQNRKYLLNLDEKN
ncbi:MAG: signal peptidase I, partial [Flavicella sp.]|nr:signal peptidase I [Flavicella sp.]